MLGHDSQGEVGVGIATVFPPRKFTGLGDYGREQVGLIDVVLALQDHRCPLQSHPGV